MKQKKLDHRMMTRYLLGELSEPEKIQMEEQYFSDDEFFEQLLAVEEELTDDYVQGALSPQERERFERHFLTTPQRRQRVEFARTLQRFVAEARQQEEPVAAKAPSRLVSWWQALSDFLLTPRPALQLSFAMTLLFAIVGGSWLFVQTKRLQDQLAQFEMERAEGLERRRGSQQQTDEQREQSRELANELENAKRLRAELEQKLATAPSHQAPAVSFALSSGAVRDIEGAKRLVIPRGAEVVQLQPDFEDESEYKSYRAALKTAEGEEVWSQGMLKARLSDAGKTVVLNVPALVFSENDYILTLSRVKSDKTVEVVGSYSFSVVRK